MTIDAHEKHCYVHTMVKSKKKRRKRRANGEGRERSVKVHTAHRSSDVRQWKRVAERRGITLTRLIELAMRRYLKDDGLPATFPLSAEFTLGGIVYLLKGEATRDEAMTRAKGREKTKAKKTIEPTLNGLSVCCPTCQASHSAQYCPRCGTERPKR